MSVTRRGGNSGKVCTECKEWKLLMEFDLDNRPGMFKGYRKSICKACMKAKKK
jgi:hypothetical protein